MEPKAKRPMYNSEDDDYLASDDSGDSEFQEPPIEYMNVNQQQDLSDISSDDQLDAFRNSYIEDDTSDEEVEFSLSPSDPFNVLPTKALEIIMSQLTGADLKSSSLVSKFWYRKIAESEAFPTKLTLNIDLINNQKFQREEDLQFLLRSRRRFADVNINIKNNQFVDKKIDDILKKQASSIKSLRIEKIGGFKTILKSPLSFFVLESLTLHVSCGRLNTKAFSSVHTLKALSVDGVCPEAVEYCLVQNQLLEELTLYENSVIAYFDRRIIWFGASKLKKLSILDHLESANALSGEFPAQKWDPMTRMNFTKFLRAKSSSLTSLHLSNCIADDLNRITNSLPCLQCLEINRVSGDYDNLKYKRNSSIKTFIASSTVDDELIQFVVNCFVNLKSAFIGKIKTHQFFFTVMTARELKQFCYFWASATKEDQGKFVDLKRMFEQVMKFRSSQRPKAEIRKMKKEDFMKMINC